MRVQVMQLKWKSKMKLLFLEDFLAFMDSLFLKTSDEKRVTKRSKAIKAVHWIKESARKNYSL